MKATEEVLGYLEVNQLDNPTRRIILTQTHLLIGRSNRSADIHINDQRVSRAHAKIMLQPDGTWALMDLYSANGTFLAGEKLPPTTSTHWLPGQTTTIGHTRLTLIGNDIIRAHEIGEDTNDRQSPLDDEPPVSLNDDVLLTSVNVATDISTLIAS